MPRTLQDRVAELENRWKARFRCVDCEFDTLDQQYYMVSDELWARTGLGPQDGMLCLACFERRSGHRLQAIDFTAMRPSAEGWQRHIRARGF
jgi:hypothetical protein